MIWNSESEIEWMYEVIATLCFAHFKQKQGDFNVFVQLSFRFNFFSLWRIQIIVSAYDDDVGLQKCLMKKEDKQQTMYKHEYLQLWNMKNIIN